MIKSDLFIGLMIVAGASLSACHKTAGSDASASANFGTGSDHPEDQFGKGFGEKFRADPYSKPTNVEDNDVTPVSTTAEPVNIN